MLVCARLRHVAGTQWGNKKYMNLKHLEAAFERRPYCRLTSFSRSLQTFLRIILTVPAILNLLRAILKKCFSMKYLHPPNRWFPLRTTKKDPIQQKAVSDLFSFQNLFTQSGNNTGTNRTAAFTDSETETFFDR